MFTKKADLKNFTQKKLELDINESLSIDLISKNSKNTVLSAFYRPPDGDFKALTLF